MAVPLPIRRTKILSLVLSAMKYPKTSRKFN